MPNDIPECCFEIVFKHINTLKIEIFLNHIDPETRSNIFERHFILYRLRHSVRNDFTGLATAAFIAWMLMVAKAISIEASPANANSHHDIFVR